MLPAASNHLPINLPTSSTTPIKAENSPIPSGPPRPRPKAHSNFFQASAYSIKALFHRALCTIKECGLSAEARTQKCNNINVSIHNLITKKYEFKSWSLQLNAMCRQAENHVIDVPSAVYEALAKLSPDQLGEVLELASKDSSLQWLAGLISKLSTARVELQELLGEGLKNSYKLFTDRDGNAAFEQEKLWEALSENCKSVVIVQSDLKAAIKTTVKKATLGQLASLIGSYKANECFSQNLIGDFKKAAIEELKSRGKPLFHSAWLELTTKEFNCIGTLVSYHDDFNDWRVEYRSEISIAYLMQKSDDEIIELLTTEPKISSELKCVAILRMQRLRDKGVNALNCAVITRVGSLKSPSHIIPALLILEENTKNLKRYKEAIKEDFPLKLEGAFHEVEAAGRQVALDCLKFAIDELKTIGKFFDNEIVDFCNPANAGECDQGDVDSIIRSRNRIFPESKKLENDKVPFIKIDQEKIWDLTAELKKEVGSISEYKSQKVSGKGVSDQFVKDLRTYHFSIAGAPFDGFNPKNPDDAVADFKIKMKEIGANKKQILVVSELLAQTTGSLLWNRLIAEQKLFPMTSDEIAVSKLKIDASDAYFIPGSPIQEKFVTMKDGQKIHVELHIFTGRLNTLSVPGTAVSTDPEDTHCLVKMSIGIDKLGNVSIDDMDAQFSRKVVGSADAID